MYSDRPLVVSAPTGSGKTTVFELAIVRVLMQLGDRGASNVKMVYVAPIKALCSEKCEEWRAKFGPLGLECIELTGDSEMEDFFELQKANIITTTPVRCVCVCLCLGCTSGLAVHLFRLYIWFGCASGLAVHLVWLYATCLPRL